MKQLILDIRPDASPVFEHFLPGPNIEPLSALRARAQAAEPFADDAVLYLWGDAGVGKSHLLQAWAHACGAHYHDAARAPLGLPDDPPRMLALDNAESLDESAQASLFATLNRVREQGGRLLVAGPLPPSALSLRADVSSRLAQGLVFHLRPLSDRDKAQALNLRAEALGVRLPEDVTHYLITHCRRDLHRLLAMVDALDAASLSQKRAISVALLRTLLQQGLPLEP